MDGSLQLPATFNGKFGLVLYHQGHGVLLLRSSERDDGGPKRIDILFKGVVWMSLPTWFDDFTIEQCLIDEIIGRVPPDHRGKSESRHVYRLITDRTPQYVIAGSVFMARDDRDYFEPSPLLPWLEVNLKFEGP